MARLHFRLSFRKNPNCGERFVFFASHLSLVEPFLLCASVEGLCPLLSVVYLDENSKSNGVYLHAGNAKLYLHRHFPDRYF